MPWNFNTLNQCYRKDAMWPHSKVSTWPHIQKKFIIFMSCICLRKNACIWLNRYMHIVVTWWPLKDGGKTIRHWHLSFSKKLSKLRFECHLNNDMNCKEHKKQRSRSCWMFQTLQNKANNDMVLQGFVWRIVHKEIVWRSIFSKLECCPYH